MSQQTVDSHSLIDLQLTLDWESEQGHHREIRHFPDFNVWRDLDLLPAGLQQEILHQPQAHVGCVAISAGEVIPEHRPALVHLVRNSDFNKSFQNREVAPHPGRFYPQGMVSNLPGVYDDSILPLRIITMDGDSLTCDLNHALAGRELAICSAVRAIHSAPAEHGGRCQDAMQQLLHGPGMQIRAGQQPTDFFTDHAFRRMDESADSAFYALPRMTDHLDALAEREISRLYGDVLPAGASVLDLMASTNSHLPESLKTAEVVGLGMNAQELEANPALSTRLVQDINANSDLAFQDASFDAVVCTVSVEYLTHPLEIFREIYRVLKPGGVFINTFSNRWFPPKVIDLWIDLHEFERMGLVSEYYLRTRGFERVHTWSKQGLQRPEEDKYSDRLARSDPLYAVWAYKTEA